MQEATGEPLQIAYSGPGIENGRMAMDSLATGLKGQSLLIHRVSNILYGDGVTVRVEVDPDFEQGSLVIPVHILVDGLKAARHTFAGETATALANFITIVGGFLGFTGVSGFTLYSIFKRLKGRRIEKPEDVPRDIKIDVTIELLIRVYNDPEVQAQLRKTLDPLHEDGVEEFQTRRAGAVIETVHKRDLVAADEAELEDVTRDEEIDLDIEKAAWRRNLAWHFSDGRTSFDAKIEDADFWKTIDQGEAFSEGDKLRVHLQTTARRTRRGALKVQRTIPKVFEVDHVRRRQPKLFDSESEE